MKIESRIGKSSSSDKQIYGFITDFNNFKSLVPADRVSQWESSAEQCSFRVDPVGKATLKIVEKTPFSLVKIASVPDFSTYNFTIWIQLKKVDEIDTRVKIHHRAPCEQIPAAHDQIPPETAGGRDCGSHRNLQF